MFWYGPLGDVYAVKFTGGEISGILENNVELTAAASLVAMTAGSFFHDTTLQYIYMWTTNSDNPNTNRNTYLFIEWEGFCSRQDLDYIVDFQIQGAALSKYYHPGIDVMGMASITQSVPDFWRSIYSNDFGAMNFLNTPWWYEARAQRIFTGADISVKIGDVGDSYGDYTELMRGTIGTPTYSDYSVSVRFEDTLNRELTSIPAGRFSVESFPDADPSILGKAQNVLLGDKSNITPPQIDTTNFTYQISQTVFTRNNLTTISFELESIDAVYKDGAALTLTTDYTQDLTAGTVTLNVDPGDSEITVDAHGLKIGYDFTAESWTGAASHLISDFLYFTIAVLCSTANSSLDLDSFEDMQASHTRECAWYLNLEELDPDSWMVMFQQTGQANIVPDASGKISFKRFDSTAIPGVTIAQEDHGSFSFDEVAESVYSQVTVTYDADPTTGAAQIENRERVSTGYLYGKQRVYPVSTLLKTAEDARDTGDFYLNFLQAPAVQIEVKDKEVYRSWGLVPMDKIATTKKVTTIYGTETTVFDEQSFVITKLSKTAGNGTVIITAQKDPAQIHGFSITNENGEILVNEAAEEITT